MRKLILAVLLVGGCTPVCQQIKATRCSGNIVEVCGSNKRWHQVMECSQVTPISSQAPKSWVCGQTTTGYTCIPGGK